MTNRQCIQLGKKYTRIAKKIIKNNIGTTLRDMKICYKALIIKWNKQELNMSHDHTSLT